MRLPVIAIDVDVNIIDNLTPWFQWAGLSQEQIERAKAENGSFDKFIKTEFMVDPSGDKHHIDPISYWKQRDLYENATLLPGVKECIDYLETQAEVVFVTTCFAEHKESKQKFLNHHFPDIPIIDTTHKYYVNFDAIIDDNTHLLSQVNVQRQRLGIKPALIVWNATVMHMYMPSAPKMDMIVMMRWDIEMMGRILDLYYSKPKIMSV